LIEFSQPNLPDKIAQSVFNDASIAACEWCSPRSFRLEAGLAWLASRAFVGEKDQQFWFIGPDFGACVSAMNTLKGALTPGSFTPAQRAPAFNLINGSSLFFKSAENINALFADAVFAAVIDQAIHVPEKAWSALQRTFANTHTPLRVLSTVAGRANWFYDFARQVERDNTSEPERYFFSRFSCYDALEAELIEQEDIDYARATLPDHVFRALYLAEAYDDRIEAAHKAADARLMTDTELAIIANIDPNELDAISDEELASLAQERSWTNA
jgi:hypothetical protein